MDGNEFLAPLTAAALAPYLIAALSDWIGHSGRHGFGAHAPDWFNKLVRKR